MPYADEINGVQIKAPAAPYGSLVPVLQLDGKTAYWQSIAHGENSNPTILYVSTAGSDSNDGLGWSTAKLTVYAALTSLPSGNAATKQCGYGTVIVSDGVSANSVSGAGIWLMGSNDPNFANPPSGWLKSPDVLGGVALNIIGLPNRNYGPNPHIGRSAINLGGNAKTNPVVWLSGCSGPQYWENIFPQNGTQSFRIGVDSQGNITPSNSGCAGITLRNCTGNSAVSSLPAWTIGGESFWISLIDCGASGNIGTGGLVAADDNAQSILIDGRGSSGGQIISLQGTTNLAQGGIKFYPGSNNIAQISIEDCTEEGSFLTSSPVSPILWITSGTSSGTLCFVRSAIIADGGTATMAAVQNDSAARVFVGNAWGVNINTSGQIINAGGDYGNNYQNETVSPVRQQQGFFGGWGTTFGRVFSQADDVRRQGIASTRFVNLAPSNPTSWAVTGVNVTITTGQTDVFGSTYAASVSETNAFLAGINFINSNMTLAVGDWFVMGGWVRSSSGNGNVQFPFNFYLNTTGFAPAAITAGSFIKGDGEWSYCIGLGQVTTIGTNPCAVQFQGLTDSAHTSIFYAPTLFHIPNGTLSANEVYSLALSLVSTRSDAPVNAIAAPLGQSLMADNFMGPKNTIAATAPGAERAIIRWEAGTNAGTLKLVAYAGTSTTGTTIIDNVGAGN